MKNVVVFLLFALATTSFYARAQFPLVPYPVSIAQLEGSFIPNDSTKIWIDDEGLNEFALKISEAFGLHPKQISLLPNEVLKNAVVFSGLKPADIQLGAEGYKLHIDPQKVLLKANTLAGFRYGLQTIMQLRDSNKDGSLPAVEITDYPRFGYRGMHLDVSRHFQPLELIYKLLDQLEKHKMNVFHWHLVDDQGWRIEIKKYPKLTEIGAWRADMSHIHWNDRPVTTDLKPTYGGYYTQEEIKSVVAYAAERNITVIPEIEMPAHVMAALAAYPEYSCTGENLGVAPGGVWPITHIFCAGNDATFLFIEDILQEVMALFPSAFIHIGGDEADKTEWKQCPKCQDRIKTEGLKDEHGLQSYFIRRVERFVNSYGRRIIGWDEILEGGLAPDATVMSWRGEEGGIAAARMGHDVVMTPGSHCYFDHYQGDPSIEPVSIGGYTTLKKVYSYDPVPAELEYDKQHHILGAQANLWTEYIATPEHAEYMLFPRLAALSEVLWSPIEVRNWEDFTERLEVQFYRYDRDQLNYALSAFQVSASAMPDPVSRKLLVTLTSEVSNPEIRYTLNGKEPGINDAVYKHPIEISESLTLQAAVFQQTQQKGAVMKREFLLHKAFGFEAQLKYPNNERYDGQGSLGLTDGVFGSTNHEDGNWKGFLGDDLIAVIDLGQLTEVSKVAVHAQQQAGAWIFFPTYVSVEFSTDGKSFENWGMLRNETAPLEPGKLLKKFEIKEKAQQAQFVRVTAKNIDAIPKGHSGEGQKGWIFISEIVLE